MEKTSSILNLMRTLKANQFPYFLSLSLTGEGYRPA